MNTDLKEYSPRRRGGAEKKNLLPQITQIGADRKEQHLPLLNNDDTDLRIAKIDGIAKIAKNQKQEPWKRGGTGAAERTGFRQV